MRKFLKNSILEIFQTMYEAHVSIKKMIDKKDFENVSVLLEDCQNTAVQIGTSIESSEGEGFVTVGYLEEYCEAVYEVATSIADEYSGNKAQKTLDKKLIKAENSVKNDVKVRLEIVFCPYKASMWDSLESVWKAADEDPDCDAYVVPIPYYDRNPDYSFGEFHYEGGDYPDYVPITHYEAYNFELRRPDVVYIHNPYDEYNNVTSVDPRFYSHELKKYTECLVYIPYFVASCYADLESSLPFIAPAAIKNVDYIVYQSPVQFDLLNHISTQSSKSKSLLLGNPKLDRYATISDPGIPTESWQKCLSAKKAILLTSTLGLLLSSTVPGEDTYFNFINKLFNKLLSFEDIIVIWRPHPLMEETIISMRPTHKHLYDQLINYVANHPRCIIDSNSNCIYSFYYSDAMISDGGSMTMQYMVTEKPVLDIFGVSNYKYVAFDCSEAYCSYKLSYPNISMKEFAELDRNFRSDAYINGIGLFCEMVLNNEDPQKESRINAMRRSVVNCDGTAGEKVHKRVISDFMVR